MLRKVSSRLHHLVQAKAAIVGFHLGLDLPLRSRTTRFHTRILDRHKSEDQTHPHSNKLSYPTSATSLPTWILINYAQIRSARGLIGLQFSILASAASLTWTSFTIFLMKASFAVYDSAWTVDTLRPAAIVQRKYLRFPPAIK